jgi:hypothetical protein
MIQAVTFLAKIGMRDQAEAESLVSHLRDKGYLPVIRSMFTGMFGLAKLPEPDQELITKIITSPFRSYMTEPDEILGDIFFTEELAYVLVPQKKETLQVSVFGLGETEKALNKFCTDIKEGIKARFDGRRVRAMEFDWKRLELRPPRYGRRRYPPYRAFSEEEPERGEAEFAYTEPSYSPEDVQPARFLVDMEIRTFILKLAQVAKMREKDAADIVKGDILQHILSLGLVGEEYLLMCKQDQHTICVVPSKDDLSKDSMSSLRCSVCGRSFPQENLQVIYTLTERGKKLVDHSLWMSIWTTELLKENGVRKDTIKWGLEASGEELDVMIEDFGSRIFFELKDREFGLGDAYPFVYRTTRYAGRIGIVATMDKVSTDAKKFFEEETQRREYPVQIRYLEGPEAIQQGIAKLIKEESLLQARNLVLPFSRAIGFDLWHIVQRWLDTKIKETSATC